MEVDLMVDYPKVNRDVFSRGFSKTEEQREIARKYDWRYFDMKNPRICYGGYCYDGRWVPVVKKFIDFYGLTASSSVLDVGCAKGYMLYDFTKVLPGIKVTGLDVSEYAINSCPPDVRTVLANASKIPFGRKEFDLVISINTIHNLDEPDCREAVREIQRVGKNAFIVVDSYSNDAEKERMLAWNITGKTILSTDGWKKLFNEEGYTGDYYWFIP